MNSASLYKRFTAYLLDILLVYLLITLISSIRFINPTYEEYVTSYKSYNEVLTDYYDGKISATEMVQRNKDNYYNVARYSTSYSIVTVVVIAGYFIFFQKYNNGQTLGKKIMKIRVKDINDNKVSIIRYLLRLLPMYFIYIGNVLGLFINSILAFILKSDLYLNVSSYVTYAFVLIGIISVVMTWRSKDKQGLHDKIAKTIVVSE